MQTLKQKYQKDIAAKLSPEFGLKNILAVPRLKKAVLNVGLNASNRDPKLPETVQTVLGRITGQRPVAALAKKSISNFKIREGMVVGYRVTLRGARMYDFVERLVHVVLPRVRDFRGISEKNVDAQGNLSIGFREHLAFPEVRPEEIEKVHGLEVTLVTDAKSRARGLALFRAIGVPFQAEEKKNS